MRQLRVLLCGFLLTFNSAFAQHSPDLGQRVQRITEELRCLVCQNQSIADSHAELAVQLKSQVREQLSLGHSDAEVRDYMVQRYGDFVLYRPPVKTSTWLLWFGPALFFVIAAGVLIRKFRHAQQRLRTELGTELGTELEAELGTELKNETTDPKNIFQEEQKS